jgi:hypothetical protein
MLMLTSVMEGIRIPSARRTNAIVGCSRKSTAPTSTVVASAPIGILFRMLSFAAFFRSSLEDA